MKRIFALCLFSLSLFFMILKPTTEPAYKSTELKKIIDGDTVEYRLNEQLTYATDLHYAKLVKTKSGNEVLEQYFNAEGKPAKQSAGHYALRRVYDGSHEVLTIYLDADLQPAMNTSGYCTRERVFQGSHVIEEWYKDVNGNPTANKSGAYGRLNRWDGKRNTAIIYVDADGAPLRIKSGYAELRRSYYEEAPLKGKVKEIFYYDEHGAPVALSKGQYGVRYDYDEAGKKTRTEYLGKSGSIISSTVYLADGADSVELYFDADGKPLRQAEGHYGIRKSNGKTIYLDEEGRQMFNLNRFLHENQIAVVSIGAAILVLTCLLPRRANILLLGGYVLFILYMTFWDRSGEPRANLELFWSYKQFFIKQSLRLEILNNVWLFIPLGAILARLGCKRSVLICLALSIGIEVCQYLTGLGLAEFDDVVSNVLGGAIGITINQRHRTAA